MLAALMNNRMLLYKFVYKKIWECRGYFTIHQKQVSAKVIIGLHFD